MLIFGAITLSLTLSVANGGDVSGGRVSRGGPVSSTSTPGIIWFCVLYTLLLCFRFLRFLLICNSSAWSFFFLFLALKNVWSLFFIPCQLCVTFQQRHWIKLFVLSAISRISSLCLFFIVTSLHYELAPPPPLLPQTPCTKRSFLKPEFRKTSVRWLLFHSACLNFACFGSLRPIGVAWGLCLKALGLILDASDARHSWSESRFRCLCDSSICTFQPRSIGSACYVNDV